MKFIAAIDTIIYGRRYAQGGEVDISGWSRKQILQYLNLGLMQASQITSGQILDAMIFEGSEVSTFTDPDGKLHIVIEMTAKDLAWLTDVDPTGAGDGMVLTYDSRDGQWYPKMPTVAMTFEDLTDVEMQDIAYGDVPTWDGQNWRPGSGPITALRNLTDVDLATNPPFEGDALLYDYTNHIWHPGKASSVPGPTGPVAWAVPEPWDSTKKYTIGPPASVVTYNGNAYVAIANGTYLPTDTTGWKLIVAKGDKGDTGQTGPASTIPGPANTLKIGTVTTYTDTTPASATITGTSPNQTLNLGLPRGIQGLQGVTGNTGLTGQNGTNGKVIPAGGTYSIYGTIQLMSGTMRLYNDTGTTLTISKVRITAGTPPVGASLIIDVNKGGTTIFTTQANRPTLPTGQATAVSAAPNITAWADGEYLTIDVKQIGTTTPGADLTITVVAN